MGNIFQIFSIPSVISTPIEFLKNFSRKTEASFFNNKKNEKNNPQKKKPKKPPKTSGKMAIYIAISQGWRAGGKRKKVLGKIAISCPNLKSQNLKG